MHHNHLRLGMVLWQGVLQVAEGIQVVQLRLFSDIPIITNIFPHTFLSNHASQPLQTWYSTLSSGPTRCLLNSGLPVIYFLFYDLVYFPT